MVIHTEGRPGDPAVVLLHPMLVSGRQMIELLGRKLPGSFFLIAPDQGGHGEERSDFVSPAQEAAELHRFLAERGIREIRLLFAASMGGTTAMELMKLGGLHFHAVYLDGVPLAQQNGLPALFLSSVLLRARKKAVKDPAAVTGMLTKLYGGELGRSMTEQLAGMSRLSVRRIGKACVSGCAVPLTAGQVERLTFEWGEKEINLRRGKPLAERLYPEARILVREGLGHCEHLGREPEAYARELGPELAPAPDGPA